MQGVILAGGRGERLASRLGGRPKPLIEIAGAPLLARQLHQLAAGGVGDALVLVRHEARQIEAFLRESDWPLAVSVIDDGEPRGSAGAVLACLDRLEDRFVVVYGDTLFDIDIGAFVAAHARAGCEATLFVHPNDHPADSDLVELDASGRVTGFHGYPHPPGAHLANLVNAAFYCLERRPLERYRSITPPLDFAKQLFPRMLADGARLIGYRSFEFIRDVGTPERLDNAEAQLRSGAIGRARRDAPQAAVFLDRDGTLNELRDYVRRPDDLRLLPGAAEAIGRLNRCELRAVVVTNQPVLARGECAWEDLSAVHGKLEMELGHAGAFLDGIYVCPHHPHMGFSGEIARLKIDCDCRKPKTGLIERAAAELNIDLRRSWLVGDSTADMLAAQRAGVRSILVLTGERGRDARHDAQPDFVARDIGAAVTMITDQYPRIAELLGSVLSVLRAGDLVVVGGHARAGKSTLAATLAAEARVAGLPAQRVCSDRWSRPRARPGPGLTARHDLAVAQRSLSPWFAGGDATFLVPSDDRWSSRGGDSRAHVAADDVLVLEGVAAQLIPFGARRRVLSLFVEADERARRERVIEDLIERGATASAATDVYDARRCDEDPQIERARGRADLILSLDRLLGAGLESAS